MTETAAGAAVSPGQVHYERRGAAAHVTFDRQHARNALTFEMYEQLFDACEQIDASDVRVAVLRGAGGQAFVAGTDIGQFTTFESGEDGIDYEQRMERVIGRLERVGVPTVAVVEGPAVGGGLAIASVCDLRVATPDARFGMPIARTLGNCLSVANYTRLVALLGPARTKQLVMTAQLIGTDDALAAGYLAQVVARDELDEAVGALCERIAAHAPITMRVTKEAVRRIVHASSTDGEDLIREAYGSGDFHEGVAAFLDKRRPQWQGR